MRLVFDTNVIISRYLSPQGTPAKLFQAWEEEVFTLLVSEPILAEYQTVLGYKKIQKLHGLDEQAIEAIIIQFRNLAELVEVTTSLEVVKRDPEDNKFLECALAGRASFLVTGDQHLLELKDYQGIVILDPASFLAFLDLERH